MSPERWDRVKQLFASAAACEPAQRVVFLAEACAGGQDLRRRVRSLLMWHTQAGSLIDAPAVLGIEGE